MQAGRFGIGMQANFSLQAATNGFRRTGLLQCYKNCGANLGKPFPLFRILGHDPASQCLRIGKNCHVHTLRRVRRFRQILPDFFRGENENGRGQPDQRVTGFPDGCLCGAARLVFSRFGVKAVLQHVKIKRAEIHDAVIVDGVVHAVKFIICIPFAAFFHQLRRADQHPLVDFFELGIRQRVARRIKIAQIPQGEAERVANLAVGFAQLRHHPLAHFHVGLVFHGRDPQTQQVRAPALADLNRVKRVPQ